MGKLHNAHIGAYKLNTNHNWHVTLYKLATFGRIDATRVWELDGAVICDNDPSIEALFQSLQDEQEDVCMRLQEQADEAHRRKCERVDAELQAALSPPPTPRPVLATPIADKAPVQDTASTAPVEAGATDGAEQGLTTSEIAYAFHDVNGWPAKRWIKNLSALKWVKPALIGLGEQGGASSVWRPLTLAQLVHARAGDDKENTLKLLHTRFDRQAALAPWRDAFSEFFDTFSDAD